MRLCEHHWSDLRAALDRRGMGYLVASDGLEAQRRLKAYQDNDHIWTLDTYDPLLGATFGIITELKRTFGQMFVDLEGSHLVVCGICWANAEHAIACDNHQCESHPYDRFIDGAASDEVTSWLELSVR